MIIFGNALVMGDNVNTDVLHPSRFYSLDDARVRSGFMQAASGYEQVGVGDLSGRIVLAGDNFGCGSSRETGARVFLLAGVKAVVARSMARIFSRNVRNLGLAALECRDLPPGLQDGCGVKIDLEKETLELPSYGETLRLEPLDPFWKAVIAAGGLMPFLGFKEK
jgi:3-isopropylmalate/(R)-2-methylmalate dehydratase small subunit